MVVTPEEQQGFKTVANALDEELQINTKEAQWDFYRVKEKCIGLKSDIVRSKFRKMESTFREELKELEGEVRKESEKVKDKTRDIQEKINDAKKSKDNDLEDELKAELEALTDTSEALLDESLILTRKWSRYESKTILMLPWE